LSNNSICNIDPGISAAAGLKSGQFNRKGTLAMKFHMSTAAGLKSSLSNQERNMGVHRGDRRERREKKFN